MVSGRSLAAMPMSSDTSGIKFDSAEDTDYDDIEDNSAADVVLLSGRPMVKVKNLNISQHYCLKVSLITFHVILCLANVVCLGFAATFDILCAVKQGKTIVNCTEKALVSKPQSFVIVFYLTTITNAVLVMLTLYLKPADVIFCGFKEALKQLIRKGSFWSLNFTCILFILEYILIANEDVGIVDKAVALIFIVYTTAKLTVAYFVNYVFPVKFPTANERIFVKLYIWLAYWMTLVLFFLASAHSALATTLDFVERVSPLGKVETGSHNLATVGRLVLLGINATFVARLFLFYWNKFFHGDRDLFTTFIVPIAGEKA